MSVIDDIRKNLGLQSDEFYRKQNGGTLLNQKMQQEMAYAKAKKAYETNSKKAEEAKNKVLEERRKLNVPTFKDIDPNYRNQFITELYSEKIPTEAFINAERNDINLNGMLSSKYTPYLEKDSNNKDLFKRGFNVPVKIDENNKVTIDENYKHPTEEYKEILEKNKEYAKNSETYKEAAKAINDREYSRYVMDYEKAKGEPINFVDKINIFQHYLTGLQSTVDVPTYYMENGAYVHLPSYNEIKAEMVSNESNFLEKALQSGFSSLGQMTPSMLLSLAGIPIAPEVVTFYTTYSSARNEKLLQGYSEDEANNYALVNGALEVFLGDILGGMSKITTGEESILSNQLGKVTDKLFNNAGFSKFVSKLTAEEVEELMQTVLDPVNEYITLGEYDSLSEALSNVSGEDIALTALSTLISMGVTEGPDSIKLSNLQKNIEIVNKQYGTDLKLKDGIVIDETNVNNNQENVDNVNNETNNSENTSIIDKIKQNLGLSSQTEDNTISENTITQPQQTYQKYTYERTDNERINKLRESVSNYFEESKKTRDLVSTIEKVIKDKNYNVVFDNSITNVNGQSVNAQISSQNGEVLIKLNPNSPKAGEFLIVHEITHAIENDEIKNLVLNYASKHDDFKQALNDLKATYGVDDVSSEVLADISGQLFGNQEFINNLSLEKPNIFKRIYNSIISLANKITGNSNEALFIKDLKNKWETAYRNATQEQATNNLNNKNLYSLETLKDGTTYVKTEKNLFTKDDGTPMTQRELYKKLVGKSITLNDGTNVEIVDRLPNKDMYNELFKRYPRSKNINDIKEINNIINENFGELLSNSNDINTRSDVDGRHSKQNITDFNTREIMFYDGNQAYKLTLSVAILQDGKKVAYAKKMLKVNNELLSKIKQEGMSSTSKKGRSSQFPQVSNSITQSKENVKLPTKYSMQNNQNDVLINSDGTKIDISNLKETSTMKMLHYNRKYDKNNITTYRGESENGGTGVAMFGLGLYTTLDKNYAKRYGNVKKVDNNLLPSNPLKFKTQNDFEIWEQELAAELGIRRNKLYSENYGVEQYVKKLGYDGLMIGSGKDTDLISFTKSAIKYSEQNYGKWQEYLDKHYKPSGTRTNMSETKIPTAKDVNKVNLPSTNDIKENTKKVLNPIEISKLKPEDTNTTPKLPTKKYEKGKGESNFFSNITEKSQFLNKDLREMMKDEENIEYYKEITNKDSLSKAFKKLNEGGLSEVLSWQNRFSEGENGELKQNPSAVDVAEGWILLKQYQDTGDYRSAIEIAKTMRRIGSQAGQAVQAFNILNRLSPEGMVYYAQSELSEAYSKMVKNKSLSWIQENSSKFDLTPNEVQFILDTMNEVKDMSDGYDKRVKLAEIQSMLTDKLPPTKGAGIKAWMRISMLFNPKTQVRNVLGNAVIGPVNYFSDMFSSIVDRQIAKKTGVRTTGKMDMKNYYSGFKKGVYESYNDFKKGINTRNMEGNRFEITEGKAFNNNTLVGKKLNQVDNLLSFMLDVGDRGFYEATFTNSINNQLTLNNTQEVTQEMIDIATEEALQRTWQDNNEYTKSVLAIRRMFNKLNVKGYGLGDVLIPFAKTPANLTKAIVDYSPIGLVKTLATDAKNLKNSLENGQYSAQLQHRFVQNLGKGMAGTFLYVLGYSLAKAGIISGENDDDKDVSNFMKNSVGMNSYSIKIGNKSFSYDWAQPVAAPFAIMSNWIKKEKENPDADAIEKGLTVLNSGFDVLLEQSFMSTINEVLNGSGTSIENLQNAILDIPARAVPTFLKQITDMTDSTTRTTFVYDKPFETAVNKIKAKIPILSKTLEPSVDTLGNEISKYGGDNNLFNVFINPTNVSKGKMSEAGKEIYRLYEQTGDATIMPRVAPYYINKSGEKIILSPSEKTKFQKISGDIVEKSVKELLQNENYIQMNDSDKTSVVKNIVDYSYNKAREEVLGIEIGKTYNRVEQFSSVDGTASEYYSIKDKIASFTGDDKKSKIINYINSQPLTIEQKAVLIRMQYSSFDDYNTNIVNYINSKNLSIEEKAKILENLGFKIIDGKVYW